MQALLLCSPLSLFLPFQLALFAESFHDLLQERAGRLIAQELEVCSQPTLHVHPTFHSTKHTPCLHMESTQTVLYCAVAVGEGGAAHRTGAGGTQSALEAGRRDLTEYTCNCM